MDKVLAVVGNLPTFALVVGGIFGLGYVLKHLSEVIKAWKE